MSIKGAAAGSGTAVGLIGANVSGMVKLREPSGPEKVDPTTKSACLSKQICSFIVF